MPAFVSPACRCVTHIPSASGPSLASAIPRGLPTLRSRKSAPASAAISPARTPSSITLVAICTPAASTSRAGTEPQIRDGQAVRGMQCLECAWLHRCVQRPSHACPDRRGGNALVSSCQGPACTQSAGRWWAGAATRAHRSTFRSLRAAGWRAPCGRPWPAGAQTPFHSGSLRPQSRRTAGGRAGGCLRVAERASMHTIVCGQTVGSQAHCSTWQQHAPAAWACGRKATAPTSCERSQDELATQPLHKRSIAGQLISRQRLQVERLLGLVLVALLCRCLCRLSRCRHHPASARGSPRSTQHVLDTMSHGCCRPGAQVTVRQAGLGWNQEAGRISGGLYLTRRAGA